tara:strand:+ start:13235 stop:14971 length:1737 start_codon:yes stop_codon:yes gene_type:complete
MPVANVSDIIGRRDLAAEAQGWSKLILEKQKMRMQEEKQKEASKPKPYKFDWVDWSSQNPMGEQWMQDLGKQSTLMTQADAKYLSIPYYDTDRCGPECQQAWARYWNNKNTAKTMQNFQVQLQKDYAALLSKYNDDSGEWRNAETKAQLERMKDWWKNGIQWSLDENGNLNVVVDEEQEVPMTTEDGSPIYLNANGEQTTNVDEAVKGDDGQPKQATETKIIQKETSLQEFYQGLDLSPVKNVSFSPDDLSKELSDSRLSYLDNNGQIISEEDMDADQKADYDTAKASVESYIFGSTGYWNNETGTGEVTAKGRGVVAAMRRTPPWSEGTPITKDDILNFALNQSSAHIWEPPDEDEASGIDWEQNFTRETVVDGDYVDIEGNTTQANYAFHGSYEFSDVTGNASKSRIEFSPSKLTLTNGDAAFRTGDIPGTGQQMDMTFVNIGLSKWDPDSGRFISEEEYNSLGDDAKERIIWKTALESLITTSDLNVIKAWKDAGLLPADYSEKTASIEALVPTDGREAALSHIGPQGNPNAEVLREMNKRADYLNGDDESGNDEIPDNDADNDTNNDDPLGILE